MKNYGLIDLDELEKLKAEYKKYKAESQLSNKWDGHIMAIAEVEKHCIFSLPSAQQVFEAGREKEWISTENQGQDEVFKYPTLEDFINQYK